MSALERRAVEIAQEWEFKARRWEELAKSATQQADHFLGQREHLRMALEAIGKRGGTAGDIATETLEAMP